MLIFDVSNPNLWRGIPNTFATCTVLCCDVFINFKTSVFTSMGSYSMVSSSTITLCADSTPELAFCHSSFSFSRASFDNLPPLKVKRPPFCVPFLKKLDKNLLLFFCVSISSDKAFNGLIPVIPSSEKNLKCKIRSGFTHLVLLPSYIPYKSRKLVVSSRSEERRVGKEGRYVSCRVVTTDKTI